MSITLGSYTFPVLHKMENADPWEFESMDVSFYGVPGSLEIADAEHGRFIPIECTFTGYSTPLALKQAMELVDAKKSTLRDMTLNIVIGASTLPFLHCSFRGFLPQGPAYYDGSTVNGWRREGILLFRQLQRTT